VDALSKDAVVVVGAGISGIACAHELTRAGNDVVVLDRGRVAGGRMARWTRGGRAVDIGAAYFTVHDPGFRAVTEEWGRLGLAHPWTDTLMVSRPGQPLEPRPGPMRWSAEGGLRSLVEQQAAGLDVRLGYDVSRVGRADEGSPTVDGHPVRAVVLAMPDPQARDLLDDSLADVADVLEPEWLPVVSAVLGYHHRTWPAIDGVFVHDAPVSLVVDDGRRRGDGAPVLVAHSTHDAAGRHLDDPAGFIPVAQSELRRIFGQMEEPVWAQAKRWGSAEPARSRDQTHLLTDSLVAVCGDGWSQRARIEAAWLSGRDAGRCLASRLR
jgi:renalase